MAKVPDHSEQPLQKMFPLLLFKCFPPVPIVLLHLSNSIQSLILRNNNLIFATFNFGDFHGSHLDENIRLWNLLAQTGALQ